MALGSLDGHLRDQVGGQIAERGQDEAALPHAGMRHLEVGLVDNPPEDLPADSPKSIDRKACRHITIPANVRALGPSNDGSPPR